MITVLAVNLIIFLVCFFGLVFAAYNAWWVSKINLHVVILPHKEGDIEAMNKEHLLDGEEDDDEQEEEVKKESVDLIKEIGEHISSVKKTFLFSY